MEGCPVPIHLCAAMQDADRGIGYKGHLCWPPIREDYDYFTALVLRVTSPEKRVALVRGRVTWEGCSADMRMRSEGLAHTVLVSRTCRSTPPGVAAVARSFPEAVDKARHLASVETIWIMGGQDLYTESLSVCSRVYLTRIFAAYPSDTYFPSVGEDFRLISCSDRKTDPNNGVQFRFEIYDRPDVK